MSDYIEENDVHRIVNDKLEIYDGKIDKKLDKIDKDNEKVTDTLQGHTDQLTGLKTTLSAIYGNGSGKPGILDNIQKEQKAVKAELAEETKRQAIFRHELRNEVESIKIMKASELKATADAKSANKEWIKWVAGGLGFVLWELIKIYVLKGK